MSSSFAKQKKRLRRKRAMTDEQAERIIVALNNDATAKRREVASMKDEISEEAYKRFLHEYTPELQGEMMLYFLAYLRCHWGFGRERLRRVLHEFNEFADTMRRDNVHSMEVRELLWNECGINVVHEFELCDIESRNVEKNLNREAI